MNKRHDRTSYIISASPCYCRQFCLIIIFIACSNAIQNPTGFFTCQPLQKVLPESLCPHSKGDLTFSQIFMSCAYLYPSDLVLEKLPLTYACLHWFFFLWVFHLKEKPRIHSLVLHTALHYESLWYHSHPLQHYLTYFYIFYISLFNPFE